MSQPSSTAFSNRRTLVFMLVLSFVCAFVLSVLASALDILKSEAKELDRSKEMLVAGRIYDNARGCFLIFENGSYIPARHVGNGRLVASKDIEKPSSSDILAVVRARTSALLVDDAGNRTTFEKEKIDEKEYIATNKKKGYANLQLKLAYELYANPSSDQKVTRQVEGYIIPVSGFGLWDYIYGYIAVRPDGDEVIGISWYEQKETPGLGANIAETPWQSQFSGKVIFQPDSQGKVDMKRSSLGITVVRGKVKEVIGDSPRSANFVDGMAGATLTGNGVTKAYKDTLGPYRPFFCKLHDQAKKGK